MNYRFIISLFLMFFVIGKSIAQYENIKFSSLTVNDGLSEDNVSCVLQDSKGFMWFGTESGLNRYDGYDFKIYIYNPNKIGTISSNNITRLYEDREGVLWVGTFDGGLNRYDPNLDKFTVYKNNPLDSNTISGNAIRLIFEDSKGFLWVGTRSNGLNKFDKKKQVFTHYIHNVNDSSSIGYRAVWSMCEDKLGNLWVGTLAGLDKFDIQSGKFIHFRNDPADPNSISDDHINCMYLDNQDLLIGTWNGLNKFSLNKINNSDINNSIPGSAKFKRYYLDRIGLRGTYPSRVEAIFKDRNGIFWIGTQGGLVIFDPVREHFKGYSGNEYNGLLKGGINSIIEDKSGIIWAAVGGLPPSRGGVNLFDRKRVRFNVYWYKPGLPNSLNVDKVSSMCEDKEGNYWIANGESSIWKWNKTKNILKKITSNSGGEFKIFILFIDSKNVFWVCPGPVLFSGLYKFDPVTWNLIRQFPQNPSDRIEDLGFYYIFEDKEGFLWLGSNNGLYQFDQERNLVKIFKHYENDPYSIDNSWIPTWSSSFEDNDSNIWVPTVAGLNKLDRKTGKFIHYHSVPGDSNSISSNIVEAMYDDGKDNLWFPTFGGGLNKFNKQSGTFTHITKDNGFADDFMNSLLTDRRGNFWIGSARGISEYDPNNGTIKTYGIEDGLQGREVSPPMFKSKTGEMFFGGYYGLNSFYPDSIRDNQFVPSVVLTTFRLFDKEHELDTSITYKKEITLPYDSNFFSFEFSALDYTNPSKNKYAYKLEGVDKDWVHTDASDRSANYTDIKPGEYIFQVKGSNNDGLWNEESATIKIIITPPWWNTWWFRAFFVLYILGFLAFVRHRKLSKIKKEMQVKAEFTRQLIESQEYERKRLAGELHDSLGQNLLIIKNKAMLNLKKAEYNPEIINEISDITSTTLQEVREISYNLHPYQLERLGLTKAIESIVERASKSTSIKFRIEIENIDKVFSPEIEINIYRMVQECINNIIKHSQSNKADININKNPDVVSVMIEDNGKGFNTEEKFSIKSKSGLGLMSLTERAKLFQGKVEIVSKTGRGTIIKFTIPITK